MQRFHASVGEAAGLLSYAYIEFEGSETYAMESFLFPLSVSYRELGH